VSATGVVWGWMRYVYDPGPEPQDPELLMTWTDVHPWEPLTRTLHIVTAPLLVFAVGLIWRSHVAPRLFRPFERSATGLALALLFAPMVLSGVLLQTAATPEARTFWVWFHGISSSVWALCYLVHQVRLRRRAPRIERARPPEPQGPEAAA